MTSRSLGSSSTSRIVWDIDRHSAAERETEREGRAAAGLAAAFHATVVARHYGIDLREPETAAGFLGREEGVEDFLLHLGTDPSAGVAARDRQLAFRPHPTVPELSVQGRGERAGDPAPRVCDVARQRVGAFREPCAHLT